MTASGPTSRVAVPCRGAVLARVCLVAAALQAWTSLPTVAEDGPRDEPPGVTSAIAAAASAAKDGRLSDTLDALSKALVAARKRRAAYLVGAIEERYKATWKDVGKLHRAAIRAATRCDPKEAAAIHTQLEKAGLPDRLTSAASGATYDLHFAALKTLLGHIAQFNGNGQLANDLAAIGDALRVAREHELDQVTAQLVRRYKTLWRHVRALHSEADVAAADEQHVPIIILTGDESQGFGTIWNGDARSGKYPPGWFSFSTGGYDTDFPRLYL